MSNPSEIIAIAPMMEWTDRHCRYFHRLMTQKAWAYTEMVTAEAIIHGPRQRLLAHHPADTPLVLQLGGSDPQKLQKAVALAAPFGFEKYNLNVGCPSDRVKSGRFGACLMREPDLVAECLAAMQEATDREVTVKCRIGIDDMDDEAGLSHFVERVAQAGIRTFIIHARKAWLQGLSPKQNREVPPLKYQRVYRLKAAMPALTILINGGIETLEEAKAHLQHVDGVMMGRAAYHTPYILSQVDQLFFKAQNPVPERHAIASAMCPYIEEELGKGTRLHQITRHMLGLFHGQPGARTFRRILSEEGTNKHAGLKTYFKALAAVSERDDAPRTSEPV